MTDASSWTPEEEALVGRLSRAVVERRMTMPALLFLEGVRPLRSIGGNILYFFSPLVGIVLPRLDLDRAGTFLEKPGAVGYLVEEIEHREEEHRKTARDKKSRRDEKRQEPKHDGEDRTPTTS